MVAKKLKKEKKSKKPKDALDHSVDLVSPTIDFVRSNFKELFVKYLKVGLTAALVGLALFILFALITFLPLMAVAGDFSSIPPYLSSNLPVLGLLIIWAFIAFFLLDWITESISFAAYLITKEQFLGKYSGIIPIFQKIKYPVLGFLLLNLAIMVVALGIPALILFLLKESSSIFLFGIFLLIIYLLIFMILYRFFAQFWAWELLVAEKGVIDSLKSSINIVKNNIIGVFVFDILLFVASLVISVPFIILYVIGEIGFRLGAFVAISDLAVFIGIMSIYIFFRAGLALIQSAITETFILPYTYSFWRKIRQ
jgi:hypothetical protein